MSTPSLSEVVVDASVVAKWVRRDPSLWWFVDGSRYLTHRVDFPCPAEELAEALDQSGRKIVITSTHTPPFVVTADNLDALAETDNNSRSRQLICAWENDPDDSDQWVLSEDKKAAKQFGAE